MKLLTKPYTAKDVAAEMLLDMGPAEWVDDQRGCSVIHCNGDDPCRARFYFDGRLTVFCISPYCSAKERVYAIPSSCLVKIADKWNEATKKAA